MLRPATCFMACLIAAGHFGAALAQTPRPGAGQAAVTPVEISAETVNGDLRCRPPRARLPATTPLELRVVNRSELPVAFAAPKFFNASKIVESGGFTWNIVQDTFIVAPRSTVWVMLQSPVPGEYYYSCFKQGGIPTNETSGFLIVAPAADGRP
ncbi:hypothetical protein [Microvirga splendida]|uniref:EfeO-type cupredoxin-like domain-containing protein n=1 Tax=Microvirga splendida TaxID=2795727 RepID=A0ABS0Y3Y2_9HYPH|nr:hypothetical protein [Microvirga splendida]MBJ6126997.1 hypothetical protein [Microvirga splendida]